MERNPIHHRNQHLENTRGATSHHYHLGVILCDNMETETAGECYGILFVYGGNFLMEAEVDQINQIRIVMGINPQNFFWELQPRDSFQAPEVILSCSADSMEKITHRLHNLINHHIIRGK